ncbi:hypothetical protein CE91St32_22180 [Gordonibacter pamelaeae]|nr:hypothetical protein CE91St32_22180 [Gordonibacter pamelaeae]
MNDSNAAIAHMRAIVTSWRVSHLFVFVNSRFCALRAFSAMIDLLSAGRRLFGSASRLAEKKQARMNSTPAIRACDSQGRGRPLRQNGRSRRDICLFHPDFNRWSRNLTGVSLPGALGRGRRAPSQGRGLSAWRGLRRLSDYRQ